MYMSRTVSGEAEVGLHLVLADWQEGAGQGFNNEGQGAEAVQGDVTWTQREFGSLDWAAPGGDFSPDARASVKVAGIEFYTWESTSEMVADIQNWLENPATNFGWLLLGDESKSPTTKRFDTRENGDDGNRPVLVVEYKQ